MARKKNPSLRQEAFSHPCLEDGDATERIHQQWVGLYQFTSPAILDEPEKLKQAVSELDLDLMRCSLTMLRRHLEEAAIRDCALLTAERVLDTSVGQESLERWERWLMAAPCWPRLAQENWYQSLGKSAEIVVNALADSGIVLDDSTRGDIEREIGMLQLSDLLTKELMERFFPRKAAGDEGTSGQAGG